MTRRAEEVLTWLRAGPSIAEVRERYPAEWQAVQRQVERLATGEDPEEVREFALSTARPLAATPGRAPSRQVIISSEVRRYLATRLLTQAYLTATTGVATGTLRFGLVDGFVLQRLLFARGLERRPAPWLLCRALWPLLRQRRLLMPLVHPRGIYCFYSGALVSGLARLVGGRPCLEIAAGDGTLARFLRARGVQVTATDDHSWSDAVDYPPDVRRQGAVEALREHRPEVVLCSWPPVANSFERHVFATPSVQTYVVVSTRHEIGAGDWDAYRGQREFDMVEERRLSRLLLPPEAEGAVYVFRRRPS